MVKNFHFYRVTRNRLEPELLFTSSGFSGSFLKVNCTSRMMLIDAKKLSKLSKVRHHYENGKDEFVILIQEYIKIKPSHLQNTQKISLERQVTFLVRNETTIFQC